MLYFIKKSFFRSLSSKMGEIFNSNFLVYSTLRLLTPSRAKKEESLLCTRRRETRNRFQDLGKARPKEIPWIIPGKREKLYRWGKKGLPPPRSYSSRGSFSFFLGKRLQLSLRQSDLDQNCLLLLLQLPPSSSLSLSRPYPPPLPLLPPIPP